MDWSAFSGYFSPAVAVATLFGAFFLGLAAGVIGVVLASAEGR